MFKPISIREAMEKIRDGDWVLPMTQRQYVWGDRANSKQAVIRLFDSLYRSYPIGAFLLWETKEEVPYREFIDEFDPEADLPKPADNTLWRRRKHLVYDGQQRLQTLYCCLQYTFAGQVLCFDLYFDSSKSQDNIYGFFFQSSNEKLVSSQVTLCALYAEFKNEGNRGISDYRRMTLEALRESCASGIPSFREPPDFEAFWPL